MNIDQGEDGRISRKNGKIRNLSDHLLTNMDYSGAPEETLAHGGLGIMAEVRTKPESRNLSPLNNFGDNRYGQSRACIYVEVSLFYIKHQYGL